MHLVVYLSRYPLPNLGMLWYHLHIYNYLKAFFMYGNLNKKGDLLMDYFLKRAKAEKIQQACLDNDLKAFFMFGNFGKRSHCLKITQNVAFEFLNFGILD